MKYLEDLVQLPAATALGWALVHFVWQGALLACLLGAALSSGLLPSSRTRYAAACAALLAMPVVFAATAWWSWPAAHPAVAEALGRRWPGPLAGAIESLVPSGTTQNWATVLPWLAPCWMAGVLALWARTCIGWLSAQRLRRSGVCAACPEWQERFRRIRERMLISRPVVLLESCLTEVPVMLGFVRPVILLPVGLLTGLPAGQVEAFLIHELAHIGRWDYAANLAQSFIEGVLFYHPAVWWVSAKVRAERENCCDDAVVAFTGDAPGYAAALTTLAEQRWLAAEASVAANGGSLMNRIRRLLGNEQPRTAAAPLIAMLLIPGCAALAAWKSLPPRGIAPPIAGALASQPSGANRPDTRKRLVAQVPAQATRRRPASPYEAWLNEDAAYIITPQERAEFLSLQTDQERQDFIERFWQRRDPTPGTPENEFKVEHYRRIGYANQHFGFNSTAGWRTDRGRIYITYGPPDERVIYEPKSGRARGKSGEQWRYLFIDGIGNNVTMEFVDTSATGDFRMTRDPAGPDSGGQFVAPSGRK